MLKRLAHVESQLEDAEEKSARWDQMHAYQAELKEELWAKVGA